MKVGLYAVVLLALGLSGCGAGEDELRAWMEQQRKEVKPNVKPIEAPKPFLPQQYAGAEAVEPFSVEKMNVAIRQDARQVNSLLASEMNRRREPLEAYPLDGMKMVGSVVRQGKTYALLRVDGLLYQVKTGEHMGQNYGKITRITETEVALREVVQDAAGEWVERATTLELQQGAR